MNVNLKNSVLADSLQYEIMMLEMRLNEKLQQLSMAPQNPLIRQRLSTATSQLQDEINEKR